MTDISSQLFSMISLRLSKLLLFYWLFNWFSKVSIISLISKLSLSRVSTSWQISCTKAMSLLFKTWENPFRSRLIWIMISLHLSLYIRLIRLSVLSWLVELYKHYLWSISIYKICDLISASSILSYRLSQMFIFSLGRLSIIIISD